MGGAEDCLFSETKKLEHFGILSYSVSAVRRELFDGDVNKMKAFCINPFHDPNPWSYSHSEVRFTDLDGKPYKPSKASRQEIRFDMMSLHIVSREPAELS